MENKDIINNEYKAYCLYCLSGKEEKLVEEIHNLYGDKCLVLTLKRFVHKSKNGNKYNEIELLIKNYVFLYLLKDIDIKDIKTNINSFIILKNKELGDDDLAYAKWILEQNGVLGLSYAVIENQKVKIISGPLKDLEGTIVEYSKKNRNCKVKIEFLNQEIVVWLPFEYTKVSQ